MTGSEKTSLLESLFRIPELPRPKQKTPFPLERIFTVSLTEYCASKGKQPSDYELKGVHVDDDALEHSTTLIGCFRLKVPIDAEAVVEFRYALAGGVWDLFGSTRFLDQYASGTALVPKKKSE